MIATVYPSHCSGSVHIPPSKSMAHRAIICAALADGVSHLTNIDFSDDIRATIDGMRQLGAQIDTDVYMPWNKLTAVRTAWASAGSAGSIS